jgi:hypothetical protein
MMDTETGEFTEKTLLQGMCSAKKLLRRVFTKKKRGAEAYWDTVAGVSFFT